MREVNIDQEIIDAYTGANEELSQILQYAYILEEAMSQDGKKLDRVVDKLAPSLRMEPFELKNRVLEAQTMAEEILRI